ncbi:terminase gpA endonuclease subunit [Thalassospira sp. MCCC 1A01428]|uniref:terminase gpA endonuclease subunit n=1 Tax=Thalassospira sp. MCCC 1A01428 TaxID=1470575 RepID=UPI000A1E9706|nr:terminase gpA endonuclease subunit [Thalassospira sp. MCCC 1A01428]
MEKTPLPDFRDPWVILSQAAAILLPPKRISVSEAAARYRRVVSAVYNGPWDNSVAPYMVEPMNMTAAREYEAVVFVGPAQSLKTDALLMNRLVHMAICDPVDTLVLQMNAYTARRFSINRMRKLIDKESPEFKARMSKALHSDNINDKKLASGAMISITSPSVPVLSSEPIPLILITDRDRMVDDLDGEGEIFDLGRQRTKTFGSRGMTVAESSPGRDFVDGRWKAKTAHEAPPVGGIISLYNRGDRRRRYWICPDCHDGFEPSFNLLDWPETDNIDEAAQNVTMHCPHCGGVIHERQKRDLDANGHWLAEGLSIVEGEIVGTARVSEIASYWLKGPAAVFQGWKGLVTRYLTALDEYARTGSETSLRTTVNTDQAEPYMPRAIAARAEQGELTVENLFARCEDYPLGTVPDGVLFLVAAADVQGNRFVIQIEGFGAHLERWIVDRFEIAVPEQVEGWTERALDPAAYAEDWQLLRKRVLDVAWPMASMPGKAMKVKLFVYDIHGRAGVTSKAYDFYRDIKRRGQHERLLPLRGIGGFRVPRAVLTWPDSERKDKYAGARGEIPVLQAGVDHLKDFVMGGLRREQSGPQYIHIPRAMGTLHLPNGKTEPDEAELMKSPLAEYLAEIRKDKGWEKEAARNEAFDLSGYCTAAVLRLNADKMPWDKPEKLPNWMGRNGNPFIVALLSSGNAGPVEIPMLKPSETDENARINAMISQLA